MAEVLHHDNHGHDGHHEHDDTGLNGLWFLDILDE